MERERECEREGEREGESVTERRCCVSLCDTQTPGGLDATRKEAGTSAASFLRKGQGFAFVGST